MLNTLQCFENDRLPQSIWVGFSEMLSHALLYS